MNIDLLNRIIRDKTWKINPPGCQYDFVASPIGYDRFSCEIGVVSEHRFAFYFWANFYQDKILTEKYRFPKRPALISLDYHNDVGADRDYNVPDLIELNLSDKNELGFFCWYYLNPLNDGQILPSLYFNLFSDVLILTPFDKSRNNRSLIDRFSNEHKITYFKDIDKLIEKIDRDIPIFLDIDLDYFTRYPSEEEIFGTAQIISTDDIINIVRLENNFMTKVHQRIIGLTIAIESKHCGGINNSNKILEIINNEFFNGTLLTERCKWKNM